MSSWPGYREWYRRNRKSLSKKRKLKYKTNKTYREDQKKRANDYYHNVKKTMAQTDRYTLETKKGEKFVTIGRVAKLINRHVQIVREYHRKGVIPEPLYYDNRGWRLYSLYQLKLLKHVFDKFDRNHYHSLSEVAEELEARWKKEEKK